MAIDPVLIQFAVAGVVEVGRAFDTIEQRIVRMEQSSTRASEAGASARVRAARGEAETREREYKKVQQYAERYDKEQTREAERQAKQRERITAQTTRETTRQAQRAADEEVKAADRAAREIERIEQYKMRVRIRSSEMAGRAAVAEAREESVARERLARGMGGAASRGVRGMLGTIGSLAGTGLMIGGGFEMANIARKELGAERQAALIVNEVTINGKPAAGANVGAILGASSQVSRETGMAKEEVLAGTLAYTRAAKSGDFATAMANMGFFAKIAKTTGSDITEVAKGAGMLQSENPNLKAPQMRQMLLDIMAQGHAGSIPLNEMVGLAGIVGSARGAFAGDVTTNQRKLLGLTQLARSEAGGQEEAARGIKQMVIEADKPKKAALLRSWGVHFDAHGQIASPEDLILGALRGTQGNLLQLGQVFGTRSGGLMKHVAETFRNAGRGEAGIAAVKAEMASVTGATTTPQDLDKQFEQLMATPAEKFQKALNDVSEVIAMRLEPLLGKLADKLQANAPAIEKFMTSILDLAEWLTANPWQGLGAAVSLAITREITSGAVSAATASAIKTSVGQSFASGLTIAAAAIAITEVGMMAIDLLASMDVKKQLEAVNETNEGVNLASTVSAKARAGKVGPQDIADIQAEIAKLTTRRGQQQENVASGGEKWSWFSGFLGPMLASDENKVNAKAQLRATETSLDALEKALKRATTAATDLANAQHGAARAPDPARHLPISSPGRS